MGKNNNNKTDQEELISTSEPLPINMFDQSIPSVISAGSDPQDYTRAVMHNFVARAVTRWSLEESKLFICALAQIGTHDEDGWIKLSKKDLNRVLEYKKRSSKWLRRITKNIALNSWLQFETEAGWDDGFIVNRTRSDRWNIYIRFEKDYLPLLEQLTSHFTTVYAESIAKLNHKSSYSLYLYLKSWADHTGKISHRYIYKRDIQSIFNLEPDSYMRVSSNGKEKFDWYSFEKYCLIPAIEDINQNERGEVKILEIRKLRSSKNPRYINGYYFSFKADNSFMESLRSPRFIDHKEESQKKNNFVLRKEDSLPTFEEVKEQISDPDANIPDIFKRLAEQHQKQDIRNWKNYVNKIAENYRKTSKKEKIREELPSWYTYIPTEKPSPELILQTFLLESDLSHKNPYETMERLVRLTGIEEEKIDYYIKNREELDQIVEDQNNPPSNSQ